MVVDKAQSTLICSYVYEDSHTDTFSGQKDYGLEPCERARKVLASFANIHIDPFNTMSPPLYGKATEYFSNV